MMTTCACLGSCILEILFFFAQIQNVSAVAVLLWGCTEFKLIAFAETRGCLKPACQSDFRKGHVSLFDQLTRSI
jgi:hypothetical protein